MNKFVGLGVYCLISILILILAFIGYRDNGILGAILTSMPVVAVSIAFLPFYRALKGK